MRLIGVLSTAVLSLTLAAPVYAQQEQHEQKEEQKAKPAQEEKKAQPEKKQEEKSVREQKSVKPEEKNAREEKNAKPEERNARQEQRTQEAKPERQEKHATNGRIPDDRYRANFGRDHSFRVSEGDYRNHRFQYGGYWFGFAGAWPGNWLYTQDVFVVEIDGVYYLCNPMYPGVNVELNVTL
jgi:hypothetical protein